MATTVGKSGGIAALDKALHGLTGKGAGKRLRVFAAVLPAGVELLGAVAIGVLLAQIGWALFAPLPIPETMPTMPASTSAQSAPLRLEETPFRLAAVEASAPEPEAASNYQETQLDLNLHGIFVLDSTPTAIISTPDGKQGNFGLGDTIWRDVTLVQIVSSEQVVIRASGQRETLTLVNRDPKEAATAAASASRGPVNAGSGLPIGDVATISVREIGGERRLVLQPGPNASAFAQAGLKSGDVLVAINNRRVGVDFASESRSFARAMRGGKMSLLVERDGVSVPVELKIAGIGR